MRLLPVVLALALSAHAATPQLGPERPVTPYATGTVAGEKVRPLVASDGEGFLVVWADRRSGRLTVYGARIDSSGKTIDSRPLVLFENALDRNPWTHALQWSHAFWDGFSYVIENVQDTEYAAHRVRVSRGGAVSVEAMRIHQRTWPRNALGETIQLDGDEKYQAVYFIEADGSSRSSFVFQSFGAIPLAVSPIAGGDWAIIMRVGNEVNWTRVRKGTGIVESKRLLRLPGLWFMAVAAHGASAAGLGWASVDVANSPAVGRLTTAWATIDSTGDVRSGVAEVEDIDRRLGVYPFPELAASVHGDEFNFAYTREKPDTESLQAFRGAERNVQVTEIDTMTRPLSASYQPALASSATHTLMAWLQQCHGAAVCHVGTRLFPHGQSAADVPTQMRVSGGVPAQDSPAAAATAVASMVAWREHDAAVTIRASLSPRNGAASSVVTVSTGFPHGSRDLVGPRIAATPDAFAVAWVETERRLGAREWEPGRSHVMVRRFHADGTPIDRAPVELAFDETTTAIDIAPRGNGFQVVWLRRAVVVTQSLPVSGAPGGAVRLIPEHPRTERHEVAVAQTADGAAVVWTESFGDSRTKSIVAARVSAAGELSTPVTIDETTTGHRLELAANDRELAVVTVPEDPQAGCVNVDRFTFELAPIRPTIKVFCGELAAGARGGAWWDGDEWLVTREASGLTLRAAVFDSNWNERRLLDLGPAGANEVAFARAPGGAMVVYQRRDPEADLANRLFVRSLTVSTRGRAVRH